MGDTRCPILSGWQFQAHVRTPQPLDSFTYCPFSPFLLAVGVQLLLTRAAW